MARKDEGQVLPLVALIVALVGAMCLVLGRLGGAAVARAQAQTAADAAALAGALEGRDAAAVAARWNRARLITYEEIGGDTRVRVELGGARALARAQWLPGLIGGFSEGAGASGGQAVALGRQSRVEGLVPAMRVALARASGLLGTPVPITSGYRSGAEQAALYARRGQNPYPVARPGTSRHEQGIAVDVPLYFVPRLKHVAGRVGLCHPYPVTDPVHFELCISALP
jgi:hypothetical protein